VIILVVAVVLTVAALAWTLFVGPGSLPEAEAANPAAHLEDRKSQIYDNLRDLNFEFRLGKLSDADYQKTKLGLQNELAGVLAEIERLTSGKKAAAPAAPAKAAVPQPVLACPYCKAKFDKPMKFCGECGKPMPEVKA
jgi:hypothetical protein